MRLLALVVAARMRPFDGALPSRPFEVVDHLGNGFGDDDDTAMVPAAPSRGAAMRAAKRVLLRAESPSERQRGYVAGSGAAAALPSTREEAQFGLVAERNWNQWSVIGRGCVKDTDGCIKSPNWPQAYSRNGFCQIHTPDRADAILRVEHPISIGSKVGSFRIGAKSMELLAGNVNGTAPKGRPITWSSDGEAAGSGWKFCLDLIRQSPADEAGSTISVIGSGCSMNVTDGCVQSRNWPQHYEPLDSCTVTFPPHFGNVIRVVPPFETEDKFDELSVDDGGAVSDGEALNGVVPRKKISWHADDAIQHAGWKLCFEAPDPGSNTLTTPAAPSLPSPELGASFISSEESRVSPTLSPAAELPKAYPDAEILQDSMDLLHTSEGIFGILDLMHMKNRSFGESAFSRLRDMDAMTSFGYCLQDLERNQGEMIWGDAHTDGTRLDVDGQKHWAVKLYGVEVPVSDATSDVEQNRKPGKLSDFASDIGAPDALETQSSLLNSEPTTAPPANPTTPVPTSSLCPGAVDLSSVTSPLRNFSTETGIDSHKIGCGVEDGDEAVFYYDVPVASRISIGLSRETHDAVTEIRFGGSCPGAYRIECQDDPDNVTHVWVNNQTTTQRFYFVVGGYGRHQYGQIDVAWTVEPVPTYMSIIGCPSSSGKAIGGTCQVATMEHAVICCDCDGRRASTLKYGCHRAANHSTATAICESHSLHVCTVEELSAVVCPCVDTHNSCNFDTTRVWTSTQCPRPTITPTPMPSTTPTFAPTPAPTRQPTPSPTLEVCAEAVKVETTSKAFSEASGRYQKTDLEWPGARPIYRSSGGVYLYFNAVQQRWQFSRKYMSNSTWLRSSTDDAYCPAGAASWEVLTGPSWSAASGLAVAEACIDAIEISGGESASNVVLGMFQIEGLLPLAGRPAYRNIHGAQLSFSEPMACWQIGTNLTDSSLVRSEKTASKCPPLSPQAAWVAWDGREWSSKSNIRVFKGLRRQTPALASATPNGDESAPASPTSSVASADTSRERARTPFPSSGECPDVVLMATSSTVVPSVAMGTFKLNTSVEVNSQQDGRPVYENGYGMYLYYAVAPYRQWQIGVDYSSDTNWVHSCSTNAQCPQEACSWQFWNGSAWSSAFNISASDPGGVRDAAPSTACCEAGQEPPAVAVPDHMPAAASEGGAAPDATEPVTLPPPPSHRVEPPTIVDQPIPQDEIVPQGASTPAPQGPQVAKPASVPEGTVRVWGTIDFNVSGDVHSFVENQVSSDGVVAAVVQVANVSKERVMLVFNLTTTAAKQRQSVGLPEIAAVAGAVSHTRPSSSSEALGTVESMASLHRLRPAKHWTDPAIIAQYVAHLEAGTRPSVVRVILANLRSIDLLSSAIAATLAGAGLAKQVSVSSCSAIVESDTSRTGSPVTNETPQPPFEEKRALPNRPPLQAVEATRKAAVGPIQMPLCSKADGGCAAIIDTGSNIIAGPRNAVAKLARKLKVAPDCSNVQALPAIAMRLHNQSFELPAIGYVLKIKIPKWMKDMLGQPQSVGDGSDIRASGRGYAQNQASVSQTTRWSLAVKEIQKRHGIDLRPALGIASGWKLPPLGGDDRAYVCLPALTTVDVTTQMGPLWVVGKPLFARYYARWSWPLDEPKPSIYLHEVSKARACNISNRPQVPQDVGASFADDNATATQVDLRLRRAGRRIPQGPPVMNFEDIRHPYWVHDMQGVL